MSADDVIRYYNRIVSELPSPKREYYARMDADRLTQAGEIAERAAALGMGWDQIIGAAFAKVNFSRAPSLGKILEHWETHVSYCKSVAGSIGLKKLHQFVGRDMEEVSPGFEIVKRRLASLRQWDRCRDRVELTGGWAGASTVCRECPYADGCRADRISVQRGIPKKNRPSGARR
jgi:hypothetical protein